MVPNSPKTIISLQYIVNVTANENVYLTLNCFRFL